MGGCFHPRILAATCLLPVLAGCVLSRPDGAFAPEIIEAGPEPIDFPDAGGGGGDIEIPIGDGDGPGDGDAGAVIPPPETEAFAGLVGSYMVRFDEDTFSSSKSGSGLLSVDLSMKSRVSRFVLAQIEEESEGQLVSTEWLCHQTHEHKCTSSQCGSASTRVWPSAAQLLPTALPFKRTLKLSEDGVLSAPLASTYLGFDASANNDLPTSVGDPRVWESVADADGRDGLYTELSVTVKPTPVTSETVLCQLRLVQRLETGWSVRVRSGGKDELHGKTGEFQVGDGTDGKILAATAKPTSRTEECKGNGSSQDTTEPIAAPTARFHFLGSERVRTCPKLDAFKAAAALSVRAL